MSLPEIFDAKHNWAVWVVKWDAGQKIVTVANQRRTIYPSIGLWCSTHPRDEFDL